MAVQTAQMITTPRNQVPQRGCSRWGVSDEMALLLDLVSLDDDVATARRVVGAVDRGIDWPAVIDLAYLHRLVPLLYRGGRERWASYVPGDVREHLDLFFRKNALANLRLVAQLVRTLALLDQAEIPAIPYKGAVLAQRLYGNPGMRLYGDIDLLLHPEDVPRALRLLVDAGYHAVHGLDTYLDANYMRNKREARMLAPETGVMVEIQWRVAAHWEIRQASDGMSEMWSRCEWIKLAGHKMRTFCSEDLMVVLCAHASCHCWQWPSSVCDIAELIRITPIMDWKQVMGVAARLHIRRMVLLAVYLVEAMLGQPVPEPLQDAVAHDRAALERLGRLACLAQTREIRLTDHLWQEAGMHIALRERPADKLVYLRHYLTAYARGLLRRKDDMDPEA